MIQLCNKDLETTTTTTQRTPADFSLPWPARRGPAWTWWRAWRTIEARRSSGVVIRARPIRSPWSAAVFINHRYPERTRTVFRRSPLRRRDPAGDLAPTARAGRSAARRSQTLADAPVPSQRLDKVVHKWSADVRIAGRKIIEARAVARAFDRQLTLARSTLPCSVTRAEDIRAFFTHVEVTLL